MEAKKKKPWYFNGYMIVIYVLLVIGLLGNLGDDQSNSEDNKEETNQVSTNQQVEPTNDLPISSAQQTDAKVSNKVVESSTIPEETKFKSVGDSIPKSQINIKLTSANYVIPFERFFGSHEDCVNTFGSDNCEYRENEWKQNVLMDSVPTEVETKLAELDGQRYNAFKNYDYTLKDSLTQQMGEYSRYIKTEVKVSVLVTDSNNLGGNTYTIYLYDLKNNLLCESGDNNMDGWQKEYPYSASFPDLGKYNSDLFVFIAPFGLKQYDVQNKFCTTPSTSSQIGQDTGCSRYACDIEKINAQQGIWVFSITKTQLTTAKFS